MSGGEYDYICYTLTRVADDIADTVPNSACPSLRKYFVDHLQLVSKALHDIEWVDSGDYPAGGEEKAIKNVFEHRFPRGKRKEILRG